MLFGGFGSTRVTLSSVGSTENPYFEKLADLWQIWPYSRYRGPDSVMQSGASPGSSVGDTNDWILFLWFILIVFVLGSGLLPHTRSKTLKTTVF